MEQRARIIDLPFPSITIRSISKQAINFETEKGKKGLTLKAGYLLSLSAGEMVKNLMKEAALIAKQYDQAIITRGHIIEACMKIPKYRFIIHHLKIADIQKFFGPPNELSRRIVYQTINRQLPLSIPFVAPNPPGRPNTEDDPSVRESENTEAIYRVISKSNSAYMMKVPAFLFPKNHFEGS